jgi:hypothetical protein
VLIVEIRRSISSNRRFAPDAIREKEFDAFFKRKVAIDASMSISGVVAYVPYIAMFQFRFYFSAVYACDQDWAFFELGWRCAHQ